jgi:putative transcriptional regulator
MKHGARRCLQDGAEMTGRLENYLYEASGLPGVTLQNVMVYRCPKCGEHEVAIPNILGLHETLARAIVEKKERLSPQEIRFLRTHLGYSSADFARKVGVSIQTVSRWERKDEPLRMKPAVDRFVRLMVLAGDAIKEYPLEKMATEEPRGSAYRLRTKGGMWAVAA